MSGATEHRSLERCLVLQSTAVTGAAVVVVVVIVVAVVVFVLVGMVSGRWIVVSGKW